MNNGREMGFRPASQGIAVDIGSTRVPGAAPSPRTGHGEGQAVWRAEARCSKQVV